MIDLRIEDLFNGLSGEKELRYPANSFDYHGRREDADVAEVIYDSRNLTPGGRGEMFACVKGERSDGHDFARAAVEAGCAALLCERAIDEEWVKVPQIITPNARASMGEAAAVLLGRPSDRMMMIGLTGTNGKTTASYLTRSIMRASGLVVGMTGTIVYDDGRIEREASRTTPEGPDVQAVLAAMVRNGARCCVMEASSHGLHQGRLAGCKFDRMGFSNLTVEHLEYHKDMENYFAAKRLLFTDYARGEWVASVNADDEYGRRLLKEFPGNSRGFTLNDKGAAGCYSCAPISSGPEGSVFDVIYPDGERRQVRSPLIGGYNVANVLESVAIADSLSIPRDTIHRGIRECVRIPGRLERYELTNGAAAFVDFAHSPDGLEKVLSALSLITEGRLWVLWGAGGERSAEKRPIAGNVMARLAERVIISTDNPRSERPEDIAKDVESGVIEAGGAGRYEIILDRKEAIRFALSGAQPGDVVLIAGKGPENYIDYGNYKIPFTDTGEVLAWIRERGGGVVG